MKRGQLTPKEKMFVTAYISNGFNGTQAAITAGYSSKGASVTASKLLKKPRVQTALAKEERKVGKEFNLERNDILMQLYYALTRSGEDFVDENGVVLQNIHKMSPRARACIDGIKQKVTEIVDPETGEVIGRKIETEVKMTPKAHAMDLAMRHKNLFPPKQIIGEISHKHSIDWDSILDQEYRDDEDIVETTLVEDGIADKNIIYIEGETIEESESTFD